MADQKQAPIYPDDVEFATAPTDEAGRRSNTLENYCRRDLKARKYKVTETRNGDKLSVAVYNPNGEPMGVFDSVIEAHKQLCK